MIKQFFIQRLRIFSLIMCIPTGILFFILSIYANSSVQSNITFQGQTTLRKINDILDYSLYNTIYQQDMMMSNSQYNLSLKKVLERTEMDFKDYIFMSALKTLLTSYQVSNSYIYSIYLYLDEKDRFMTSSSSYLTSTNNYYDQEWIKIYKQIPKDIRDYIVERPVREYGFEEEQDIITIFKRMTFQEGVIVINIRTQDYAEMIDSFLSFPEQIFCLVNSIGEPIFIGGDKLDKEDKGYKEFFSEVIEDYKEKDGFSKEDKWIMLKNNLYKVNTSDCKYLNAYQISLIPFSTYINKISSMLGWATLIILLDVAVIIILSWITTKRSFNYINECIEVFLVAERGEVVSQKKHDIKDEYSLILNNIIFMYLKNNQMQVSLMEKQHQAQIAELRALQFQINPHFIFNTLQTIDIEIIKNEGVHATAHAMLQELARIIKYAFTNTMENVLIEEELEYLSAYFRIQEIRFANKIMWYKEVDSEVLTFKIFRLLLQPMIENCISHGMKGKGRILIKIKIEKKEDYIKFSIIDNGCGMSKEEIQGLYRIINDKKSRNVGLANVNQRLILNYGEDARLVIRSKKGLATAICFKIPCSKLENEDRDSKN